MAFLGITHARGRELTGSAATSVVAAMVAVVFAGSTLVTPLYVIYERQLGFSRITLTLIYAAYVVGNLAALLFFGGWSDRIGRRQTALPAITVAIISALVFVRRRCRCVVCRPHSQRSGHWLGRRDRHCLARGIDRQRR
jgi:MFS family permease